MAETLCLSRRLLHKRVLFGICKGAEVLLLLNVSCDESVSMGPYHSISVIFHKRAIGGLTYKQVCSSHLCFCLHDA